MNPLEKMRARLEELRKSATEAFEARGQILETSVNEGRGMNEEEKRSYADLSARSKDAEAQMGPVRERIAELEAAEARELVAANARAATGGAGGAGEQRSSGTKVTDPEQYVRDGGNGQSYFRDLAKSQLFGDRDAHDRLQRHARAQADGMEARALGNTNAAGGSGGEFAPPVWLVEDYVKLARMGRVTADLYQHSDVPVGVSSVNIPKVLTGTVVGLQTTQNTALPAQDLTTGSVGTGFTTVGGRQIVSQQLLDQSQINFDQVVTADLAGAYAQSLGYQVIYGAGTGSSNNSVVNGLVNVTANSAASVAAYTGATAATFYSKCAGMISGFVTSRLAQPTNWLMHPRRFYWLLSLTDTNGRPLVVPAPVGYNPLLTGPQNVPAAGDTGMIFLGLPIVIDPQLPTNLGAGTNQDEVFLMKRDDLWLFESPTRAEVFRETYADSIGVLFRLYAYTGTILNRYGAAFGSVATMNGTGLASPSF